MRNQKALLEIWVKERDDTLKLKIAEKLRTILDLDPSKLNFYFKDHDKSLSVLIFYILGKIYIKGR